MYSLFTMKSMKPFAKDASYLFRKEIGKVLCLDESYYNGCRLSLSNMSSIISITTSRPELKYLISYIGPWVIDKNLLDITNIAAINFHPGPPEYPGIGCTNFALYDGVKEFGITVHHMEPAVDSGEIIMVKRFPVADSDTVWTLSQKCYAYIFAAFCELLPLLKKESDLRGMSNEVWRRKPYTRKELDDLCKLSAYDTDEEVKRTVRATRFPGMPGAYIEKGGYKFEILQ